MDKENFRQKKPLPSQTYIHLRLPHLLSWLPHKPEWKKVGRNFILKVIRNIIKISQWQPVSNIVKTEGILFF